MKISVGICAIGRRSVLELMNEQVCSHGASIRPLVPPERRANAKSDALFSDRWLWKLSPIGPGVPSDVLEDSLEAYIRRNPSLITALKDFRLSLDCAGIEFVVFHHECEEPVPFYFSPDLVRLVGEFGGYIEIDRSYDLEIAGD